jgi:hypothetical protein
MVLSVAMEKIPSVTPSGIDPETVRLVAQCLNHYANPGPFGLLLDLQKPKHVADLLPNERTVLGHTCEHTNFLINY